MTNRWSSARLAHFARRRVSDFAPADQSGVGMQEMYRFLLMFLRFLMVCGLVVIVHAVASDDSAAGQTRPQARVGCANQPRRTTRRPCAIDYLPAGLISDRHLLFNPKPEYPDDAKVKGISGSVFVFVVTDTGGKVISATIVSGPPRLQQAALNAAKQVRLSPTKMSGQPIKVGGMLKYDFFLERKSP